MAKVLLTHSYFLAFDPKQAKAKQPYPPLATLYAASVLKQGNALSFHDVMFDGDTSEIKSAIEKITPDFFVICDDGFNYLTKMCLTNMRAAAMEMCRYAADRGSVVIVASSDATDHANTYLNEGASYIISGEVEQTLPELIHGLKNSADVFQIPGLIYNAGGVMQRTPARNVIKNLDKLSFPYWDLIDIERYRSVWRSGGRSLSLNIVTTRGCPYKCNWCAKPIYGNRYNSRSPENVAGEIEMLVKKYNPSHFWMSDDIFGLKPGWVENFDNALKSRGLKIRYKIQSRADLLTDEATVKALADSGCESVWMGAESGSQKILDAMDKGIKVEEISTATSLLKKYGIKACFFLQFGYPGERIDEIQLTLKMVDELKPDDIGVSVSYPLPGTKFFETVKGSMGEKKNWSHSDDLDLMFQNEYPSDFYKRLHRFLHKRFRRKQTASEWKNLFSARAASPSRLLMFFYYRIAERFEKLRFENEKKKLA